MQINFKNKKVEKQCRNLKEAKKKFPEKVAKKLFKLINYLDAAENLESVINSPVYHFHALKGDKSGLFAMDIDGRTSSYRLIVEFDDIEDEQVFTDSIHIVVIIIEEVSKHYE